MDDNGHDDRTRKGQAVPHAEQTPFGVLLFYGCFLVSAMIPVLATLLRAEIINHTQGGIIGFVGITVWFALATQ